MVRRTIRKRTYKRRPIFRRRNSNTITQNKAARIVARMGPIRRPEVKFTSRSAAYHMSALDYNVSTSVPVSNRVALACWETSQGTGENNRIGNKIYAKFIRLNFLHKLRRSSTLLFMKVRVMIVASKNDNIDPVTGYLPNFWKYPQSVNWLFKEVSNNYRVYANHIITLSQNQLTNASTGTTMVTKSITLKWKKTIEYDTGDTQPNKPLNQLFCIILPETNVDSFSPVLSNCLNTYIAEHAYFTDP